MNKYNLTQEEISQAAGLLSKLDAGYLPEELFIQINRLHVASTVVFVPLRRTGQGLEVLLIERGANDPVWPNHWHLPGTMLRPNDKEGDYSDAFSRILDGEIGGAQTSGQPEFIKTAFTETRRGRELNQLFWIEITGGPQEGRFFPVDNLPEPRIEHETAFVQQAAKIASARI